MNEEKKKKIIRKKEKIRKEKTIKIKIKMLLGSF
jgi:hypothetical protein